MDEEANEVPEEADVTEPGAGRKIVMLVVVMLGLGAGSVFGITTLGPAVGPILAERSLNGGGSSGDHGESEVEVSRIHVIDNLVVNPARSGGTRLLLTSIAVEMTDVSLIPSISEHEVELRAALIMTLGAKSTDELVDITLRAGIVAEIIDVVSGIMGPGKVSRVFIPQFVIQ